MARPRGCDNTGKAVRLDYEKDATAWLQVVAEYGVHGQIRNQNSAGGHQHFAHDPLGRITTVEDEAGGTCTTRAYGFDANSNRTSMKTFPAAADATCSTATTPTTEIHSYDTANRITDSGYTYDSFGRTRSAPASQVSGGGQLSSGYFTNDMVAELAQGAETKTFTLDPARRLRTATATGGARAGILTNHYANAGDSPSWISEPTGGWTRNVHSLTGDLAVIQRSHGATTLQLTNLHGDVVATADNAATAAGVNAYFEQTEYGQPRADNATNPVRYGWLGGKLRSGDGLAGLLLMGVRIYNPGSGRFLQVDPVTGAAANAYDYANQDPINQFDLDGRCSRYSVGDYLYGFCVGWGRSAPIPGAAPRRLLRHGRLERPLQLVARPPHHLQLQLPPRVRHARLRLRPDSVPLPVRSTKPTIDWYFYNVGLLRACVPYMEDSKDVSAVAWHGRIMDLPS